MGFEHSSNKQRQKSAQLVKPLLDLRNFRAKQSKLKRTHVSAHWNAKLKYNNGSFKKP